MVDATQSMLHYWDLSHPALHFDHMKTLNLTHHLVWNRNNRSWKLTLKSDLPASHPSVTCLFEWCAIESTASHRKNASAPSGCPGLAHGDQLLLYDKLARYNTYSYDKNYKDPCSITCSKVTLPAVGFSAIALLGGGWVQSPISDGQLWSHESSLSDGALTV